MSSRRPQGEGSVYRLPDGRWRGVADLGWHDGKRRRKYITRGTQAEVVRELRRLTAAADAGRLPIARAPNLGASGWSGISMRWRRPPCVHQLCGVIDRS